MSDGKSLPWADDEYIYVDGFKAVYSVERDIKTGKNKVCNVFLPGMRKTTVEQLIFSGRKVVMPVRLRTSSF